SSNLAPATKPYQTPRGHQPRGVFCCPHRLGTPADSARIVASSPVITAANSFPDRGVSLTPAIIDRISSRASRSQKLRAWYILQLPENCAQRSERAGWTLNCISINFESFKIHIIILDYLKRTL
ncbi:hypothetical protein, partial [Prosthecodimorpha staleyi]